MIAVIIPFYQREPGLLHRALLSVSRQRLMKQLQILVVDDGSPVDSEEELAGLPLWLLQKVQIIRQPNSGPGAARNRALDALSPRVETVAFLDSDDTWSADHLVHVEAARRAGAGFYFADHWRQEEPQTRFTQCGYLADGSAIGPQHDRIGWCDPGRVMQAVVRRSPVGTSTVAIGRDLVGLRRFPTAMRTAGEDSLFWLELLGLKPRVAASRACEAFYGRGVSVFNHRSWGDARSLRTLRDEMRAQRAFGAFFPGDQGMAARIADRCRDLDRAFWRAALACARRGCWRGAGPATLYIMARPQALWRLPGAALQAVRGHRSEKALPLPSSRTG